VCVKLSPLSSGHCVVLVVAANRCVPSTKHPQGHSAERMLPPKEKQPEHCDSDDNPDKGYDMDRSLIVSRVLLIQKSIRIISSKSGQELYMSFPADRQTDKQTDRQRDRLDCIQTGPSKLVGGANTAVRLHCKANVIDVETMTTCLFIIYVRCGFVAHLIGGYSYDSISIRRPFDCYQRSLRSQ